MGYESVAPAAVPRYQSDDVGVAEPATERGSTAGANPRRANAVLNILPGSTIAMYWSAVTMFVSTATPVASACQRRRQVTCSILIARSLRRPG